MSIRDDEKREQETAAIESLRTVASSKAQAHAVLPKEGCEAILALLDRPVMPRPEDVPLSVYVEAYRAGFTGTDPHIVACHVYRALYDWRTKREPVKRKAWGITVGEDGPMLWVYPSESEAERLIQNEKMYATKPRDLRIVHLVEATDD